MTLIALGLIVGSYLLGAIPFGLIIGLTRGVDVRAHGSGNIGATNVGRVLGRPWGQICLALDILKGLVPAVVGGQWLIGESAGALEFGMWMLVGLAAVLGHNFPIYLGFRGGKGVATTIGVALGIYPYFAIPMLGSLLVYGVLRLATGVVSVGSIAIAVVFPLGVYLYAEYREVDFSRLWPLHAVAVFLGLMIIVRHGGNIRRLLRGEELKPREDESPPGDSRLPIGSASVKR